MTKMKSKKMTKSTFAIIIMAIAMVAMLAFGGTYAYFTTAEITRSVTGETKLGKIAINTEAEATKLNYTKLMTNVLPGESLFVDNDGKTADATLVIDDDSNRASYIFVEVSYEITLKDGQTKVTEGLPALGLTGATAVDDVDNVYYILTTEGAEGTVGTEISLTGINVDIPTSWNNDYQEATITLSFKIKSIQASGFASAEAAYAAWTANGTPKA